MPEPKPKLSLMLGGAADLTVAYTGVLKRVFEERVFETYDVVEAIGSSAGSLYALLLCLGVRTEDAIRKIVEKAIHEHHINALDVNGLFRFLDDFGIDDGRNIHTVVGTLVPPTTTFKDLTQRPEAAAGPNLRVLGTNITHSRLETFDAAATPDMPIALAIRISTCVPIMYKPVLYKENLYVDGCLLEMHPSHLCDPTCEAVLAFSIRIEPPTTLTWASYINMIIETLKHSCSAMINVVTIPYRLASENRFDMDNLQLLIPPSKTVELIDIGYTTPWRIEPLMRRGLNCQTDG